MKYKVHKLRVNKDDAQEKLELFINLLKGEIISITPVIRPIFMPFGAISKIDYLLITEKI